MILNYMANGVRFNDKHTIDDFELVTTNIKISEPEPKTNYIDIPGMNGSLDLTETIGEVVYNNRTITFEFMAEERYTTDHTDLYNTENKIRTYLHGEEMDIYLDSDPSFYWHGRVRVTNVDCENNIIRITVEANVEPYKYDVAFDGDKWLWDPFDFTNGIINIIEYNIDRNQDITLINRDMPVSPIVTTNKPISIEYDSKTISVPMGTTKLYDIRLKRGENTLTIWGSCHITISYRAGVL